MKYKQILTFQNKNINKYENKMVLFFFILFSFCLFCFFKLIFLSRKLQLVITINIIYIYFNYTILF